MIDDLARFRTALAERPEWQLTLGGIDLPDDFVAAAVGLAHGAGIALEPARLLAALDIGPLDVAGFMPAAENPDEGWPPLFWLPAQSAPIARSPADGVPAFDWVWVGPDPFTAPFHRDTIRSAGFRPMGRLTRVRTSLSAMIDGCGDEATLAPTGFIFHMSRCGSTLAAQMLAASPHHIVMSEPEPVDAVVQWATTSGVALARQVAALRAVVAALGRDRNGVSTRYFLKLDAWHAFALPLFRAAFPDTPWIFLYRDPAEVLVSLKAEPGMHSAPGGLPAALIGFDPATATNLDDYAARLFAALFDRVIDALPDGGLAVHYPGLVGAMTTSAIPAHFGFAPSPEESAAMARAATRDAKAPARAFASDSAAKRAAVSPTMTAAIETWLAERYAMLRLQQ